MASELVKILSECDDNSSTLDEILSNPTAKQIHANTYDPAAATSLDELYEALKQSSYLSAGAEPILTELLDRISANTKTFNEIFIKTDLPEHLRQLYLSVSDDSEDFVQDSSFLYAYEPRTEANHFLVQELRLHYGEPPYTAAKLRRLPMPATVAATISLDLLQKVMSIPTEEDDFQIEIAAICADNADCLKFVWSRFEPDSKIPRLRMCLKHDSINCFKFLSEQKEVDNNIEPSDIFEHDAVNIFNHMLDQKQLAVCIHDSLSTNAVKCVESMLQREYRLTEDDIVEASKYLKYHTAIFEVLVKAKKFPLQNPQILREIIEANKIKALEMVLLDYKEVPEAVIKKIRSPDICKYLCEHNYIPTLKTVKYLSRKREVFKIALTHYIAAHGLAGIDASLCESIADSQPLETLQFAHELGCPWDEETLVAAMAQDNLDSFRYAIENGCPHDLEYLKKVAKKGSLTYQYLHLVYPKLQLSA